jgi:aspartate aminotransferase-like enzyme
MSEGDTPLLMTPGPTRIPERVLRAGLRVLHHRTAEFSEALAELLTRLRAAYGTNEADILPVHATGRAAMEGAICNLFNPGDTVVACCNGKFGEMWAGFAESYGLHVVRVATDWDSSVDPDEVADAFDRHPGARAVLLVYSDTSTAVLNPVPEVANVAASRGKLVLVDAISALGGLPFHMDEWLVDVAITSSQKCLMSSPGMAFAAVGPGAWKVMERSRLPRNYWDFAAIRETVNRSRPETPGTTPVMLVLQVLEALRMMEEEGWTDVFRRHRAMAAMVRARGDDLGFTLQGAGILARSPTLTALRVPEDAEPQRLRDGLLERGIRVAVGLGAHKPTCIRIGHMGDIRVEDVRLTMNALGDAMCSSQGR